MGPPKEKRKKRRGALDWIPKPPRLPSLSPDIEVGPDGRALVDTRNGIDEVYFLSCNPYSTNRKLFGAKFNNDEIEDYIDQFNRARSKFQPPIEPKQEGGGQDTEVKTLDHHNEDDDRRDIFESQAHTWHAVLKRRERAAFQQTTNPFTHHLTNIAPWHESLRITGTIRKIIRSLAGKHKPPPAQKTNTDQPTQTAPSLFILRNASNAPPQPIIHCAHPHCPLPSHSISAARTPYLSLESVAPRAVPALHATPGIQVADDVRIPVYMRPGKPANDASPCVPAWPAVNSANEEGEGEEHAGSERVHLSLCIPCLRDLHAGTAAAPPGNTSTEGASTAGAPAQMDEREEGTVAWRDTPPSRSSSRWTTQQTEEESGEECAEQQWRRMPKRARLAADEMQLDGAGEGCNTER